MIVVRAPLRVPFAGGLTDIKEYAASHGGATISSTVAAAAWITMLPSVDGAFEVHSPGHVERAERLEDLQNELVREALRSVNPDHPPVRVSVALDVGTGSGVGSSGAITVGLVHAARAFRGETPSAESLGAEAAHVEVETLAGASGYHDAHICARGGLLRLDYDGPVVTARPVAMSQATRQAFEESLLLFETGWRAPTKASLQTLSLNLTSALPVLHDMRALVDELEAAFLAGDLASVAHCVAEQQRLKQRLPGNFEDERVIELVGRMRALGVGAQLPGGKISGYLIVCCPQGEQAAVRAAVPELTEVPLRLTRSGSVAQVLETQS